MGPNNSRFGSFIKILKVPFYCQSPWQQLCPRAYFSKMAPQEVKFERISEKYARGQSCCYGNWQYNDTFKIFINDPKREFFGPKI